MGRGSGTDAAALAAATSVMSGYRAGRNRCHADLQARWLSLSNRLSSTVSAAAPGATRVRRLFITDAARIQKLVIIPTNPLAFILLTQHWPFRHNRISSFNYVVVKLGWRSMRMVNRSFTVICSVALAAGLLLVQVCSTLCLLSGCGAAPKNLVTQQTKKRNHCHPSPKKPEPPPAQDPHQCPHHEADAIQPASYLQADVADQFHLQPALVEPFLFGLGFYVPPQEVRRWKPLRSPPRFPQYTILRI